VASGSLVTITSTNSGWELGYGNVQQFQDIRLTQAARVEASGNGGGSIQVQGRRISVTEGSQIINPTLGSQPGKNMTIHATELVEVLGNPADDRSSRLATENVPGASGNAGNLIIETAMLRVADGGVISANPFGAGDGGNLTVRARSIEVVGVNRFARLRSSLVTRVEPRASGNAGILTIETETLRVADGGGIVVGSFDVGNSGSLVVRAKSIEITGLNQATGFTSGLFARTTGSASGNAGAISVFTDRLSLTDRGEISTSSGGRGSAGNISIQANSHITLTDGSRISSNTNTGRGNIALTTPLLLLRRGSSITTTAAGTATGGNITINAGFLVSAPNENNDIIANAFDGSGGRIRIATNGLFWFDLLTRQDLQRLLNTTNPTALDPRRLLTNDITAFSQANPVIDTGSVTLQTPNLDSLTQVTPLPTNFSDSSQLIATTCPADRGSSFTITGRGGLPDDPRQPLMGQVIWQDDREVRGVGREGGEVKRDGEVEGGEGRIVEAQAWVVDPDGTIALVAPHFQESFVLRRFLTKKLPKDKMLSVIPTSKEAEIWKTLLSPKCPLVHRKLQIFVWLHPNCVELNGAVFKPR
jgi:large exoprotein involved in heme utilization and adhesion